jgi:hypothetical protein
MRTVLSTLKGADLQQDMKFYVIHIPLGEAAST